MKNKRYKTKIKPTRVNKIGAGIRIMFVLMLVASVGLYGLIYMTSRALPDNFSVIEGTELVINGSIQAKATPVSLTENDKIVQVSGLNVGSKYDASLKLFGLFPIKQVKVNVVSTQTVIPAGTPFGIKIFTDGVMIVGMSDVDTESGPKNPARKAGIKVGDVIIKIDDKKVSSMEEVGKIIEGAGSKSMKFLIRRDKIEFQTEFQPEKSINENRYKAGIWIRDSSAGIGTMSFYIPGANIFGGLGHAICDVDTGEILPLSSGEIVPATIYGVEKGRSGDPGELKGGFNIGTLGKLEINSETGLYGTLTDIPIYNDPMPVAMKQQVKIGKAQIVATIDKEPELFEIYIEQVKYNDSSPTRNMIISITDERLLSKTGGIVQGMSGSPIVQNGYFVGAVTHVFVNDPAKGFAIFGENMLKTAYSVESMQNNSAA